MLCARGVSLQRGGRQVLHAIDVELEAGQINVVLGPNGAGKSSLLRLLAGELRADSGDCLLAGKRLDQYRPGDLAAWRAVLDVTAKPLFPLAVRDLVAMGRLPLAAGSRANAIAGMLHAYGLQAIAERDACSLSAGELQRANLARVHLQISARLNAGEYACLLLDEPTVHLDPAWMRELVQALRGLADQGAALLLVLHDVDLALALADRVLLLRAGRIQACGAPAATLTPARLQALYGIPFTDEDGTVSRAPRPCLLAQSGSQWTRCGDTGTSG